MARYLGESVAASKPATSDPLRILGERRGTFARGILTVTSLPVVAPSKQRTPARDTLRVLGALPLRQRSSRKLSTSAAVTPAGALPARSRNRRAQPANVDTVFGRSPRSSMRVIILSIGFWSSVGSDMAFLLGLGESQRVACHAPIDRTKIPRDDVRSR